MARSEQRRPEVRPAGRWQFPEPAQLWLDNGLQVLLCHRPGQYVAAAALVLDVPLSAEPSELEGVATITQRCLDEGSAEHPGSSFAESLENVGAVLGGAAGFSATELDLEVPTDRLGPALQLLAEAVTRPELRAEDIERHQQLRLAEIDQQLSNSAQRAQLAFRQATIRQRFRAARPAGGEAATVAAIRPADVAAFHQRYYRPDGATLVIAGELSAQVAEQVAAAFSGWDAVGNIDITHQAPQGRGRHCWLIDRPGAVQADVRLGSFGIDRGDPRWADLQVASHALGGAFLSRLNRVLREEQGFTYGVHLVSQPMRDGGLLAVQGSFRTEVVAPAVTLAADLLDVAAAPITAAEVADAVSYLNGVAPFRYSTAPGVSGQVATLVAAGLRPDFVNSNALALTRVTPASATQALAALLPPDDLSLVVVGDAQALAGPLGAAGWQMTVKA